MATATTVAAGEWVERARALKEEGWRLTSLAGVDRLGLGGEPRFVIVCQLLHTDKKARQTVHVEADGETPTIPSIVETWPVANFMEREAFDMFGIVFEGHPNLTRILMPDEWEGHPLRKDYGVGKVTVEFVPQPFLQIDAPGQAPDSIRAKQDVDELGQAGPPRRDFGTTGPGEKP
jgi:NADH:ubiquinone oxidoreductase subunit C